MGKSTISMAIFHSYVKLSEGISIVQVLHSVHSINMESTDVYLIDSQVPLTLATMVFRGDISSNSSIIWGSFEHQEPAPGPPRTLH